MTAAASRKGTSTANFGSSKRENHDASDFYTRFTPPEISSDSHITESPLTNTIFSRDAREIDQVLPANSVALVVTSPPYFAGKQYEETLGENGVPASYFEYLELLRDVFSACKTVLEPGGRIAVNVANLGRRPYRSLSADVTTILQDLGLLMRGEVIWWKGRAAGGSCAWGSFQRPTNPVLRDVTERVIIASKGRFDRALTPKQRHKAGFPSTATISRDEFMEATTDIWEIPPASATRVGHPAPFPIELPKRLIELYTYEGDVILDPFMGAGTTGVASLRTARKYIGFETDEEYIERANERIDEEQARLQSKLDANQAEFRVELPALKSSPPDEDFQSRAVREGRQAKYLAQLLLEECGFTDIRSDVKIQQLGVEVSFVAEDSKGQDWAFDVSGAFTSNRTGLKRTDTLWKALGKAAVLHQSGETPAVPLVLLTTDAPTPGSAGDKALNVVKGQSKPVYDLIELLNPNDQVRLKEYAENGRGE
jgi:modification methylase